MDGRQLLVYEMRFTADADLAMVLPLPTAAGSGEKALQFVSLQKYADFFRDLDVLFPKPAVASRTLALPPGAIAAALEVHQVGAFEASFVPSIADFERLDARFRLPADVWQGLPQYRDWGFAVFKLKGGKQQQVHPMAFTFPTRVRDGLFFPTMHIHDGTVQTLAAFDHALYCQMEPAQKPGDVDRRAWLQSYRPPHDGMQMKLCEALVHAQHPCWKRALQGMRRNEDLVVPVISK